uniref:BTB/POZ domain protein n=1 Tax=Mimivirus LCMiAC01 TaxID=2506608 RepID=A0A481YZK0_9VIRU|nr:MAG: BTB/POZ domain protein [Mimivirus LCMiAC01]
MDSEIVKLNVGGDVFTTQKSTLMESPWFEKFFSGKFKKPQMINGDQYFIDRDGYLFSLVLNYLRNGKTIKTSHFDKESDFEQFRDECEYFGLTVEEKWESDMQWDYIRVCPTRWDNPINFSESRKLIKSGYKLILISHYPQSPNMNPPSIQVIFGKKINKSLVKSEKKFS